MERTQRRRARMVDWVAVDWSKSTKTLARDLGLSEACISSRRHRHAPHTKHHVWGGGVDWRAVDWKKSNVRIGRETGKDQRLVAKRRKRFAPETVWTRSARHRP